MANNGIVAEYKPGQIDVLQYAEKVARGDAKTERTVMSPNYVIEFARARTNHINTFLDRQLQNMRDGARDSQALNGALIELARYSEGFDKGSTEYLNNIKTAFRDAAAQLPANSPLKAKLLDYADNPRSLLNTNGGDGSDNIVLKTEIAAIEKDLQGELKSIDKRSQEDQLYINQKMGEKSEVLQLAAMMIQQFNETAKNILGRS